MYAGRGVGGVECGHPWKYSVVPNGMKPGCVPDTDGDLISAVERWRDDCESGSEGIDDDNPGLLLDDIEPLFEVVRSWCWSGFRVESLRTSFFIFEKLRLSEVSVVSLVLAGLLVTMNSLSIQAS